MSQTLKLARPVTPLRVTLHLLYWLYDIYSSYKIYSSFEDCGPDCVHSNFVWLALAEHSIVVIATFYTVGYFVVPSVVGLLIKIRQTPPGIRFLNGSHVLALAKVGGVMLSICLLLNVEMYYFFLWLYRNVTPVPDYIIRNMKPGGEVYEAGPLGVLTSFTTYSYLFAFYFSDILIPILLKLIGETVSWGSHSVELAKRNEQLVRDQLAFLRQQINPHFLFNVLNSVQANTYDVAPKGYQIVNKLASLLRFSLGEANRDREWVPLREEIQFITDYVELEQQRQQHPEQIVLTVTGDADEYEIPPLLLITFIENAFKHGLNQLDGEGYVHLSLDVEEADTPGQGRLRFVAQNTKPLQSTTRHSTRVGLANVKQRLALLFPDNTYRLHITEEPEHYRVELDLPLRLTPLTGLDEPVVTADLALAQK